MMCIEVQVYVSMTSVGVFARGDKRCMYTEGWWEVREVEKKTIIKRTKINLHKAAQNSNHSQMLQINDTQLNPYQSGKSSRH